MKIGDIEYTRHFTAGPTVANSSVRVANTFAMGIKVRPLLTRVQCWQVDASAATSGIAVFLENGQDIATAQSLTTLRDDARAMPVLVGDMALATNGMGFTFWAETLWWKILMPDIRLHFVSTVSVPASFVGELHYRFATLTDDEIIEIAAQRAQS